MKQLGGEIHFTVKPKGLVGLGFVSNFNVITSQCDFPCYKSYCMAMSCSFIRTTSHVINKAVVYPIQLLLGCCRFLVVL
jgi:hypothetical protein